MELRPSDGKDQLVLFGERGGDGVREFECPSGLDGWEVDDQRGVGA